MSKSICLSQMYFIHNPHCAALVLFILVLLINVLCCMYNSRDNFFWIDNSLKCLISWNWIIPSNVNCSNNLFCLLNLWIGFVHENLVVLHRSASVSHSFWLFATLSGTECSGNTRGTHQESRLTRQSVALRITSAHFMRISTAKRKQVGRQVRMRENATTRWVSSRSRSRTSTIQTEATRSWGSALRLRASWSRTRARARRPRSLPDTCPSQRVCPSSRRRALATRQRRPRCVTGVRAWAKCPGLSESRWRCSTRSWPRRPATRSQPPSPICAPCPPGRPLWTLPWTTSPRRRGRLRPASKSQQSTLQSWSLHSAQVCFLLH